MFEKYLTILQVVEMWRVKFDTMTEISSVDHTLCQPLAHVGNFKPTLLGFFVGQVMKASKGKANPAMLNKLLTEKLKG